LTIIDLPEPSTDRVAVHVTRDALRQIKGGHPWVWSQSIQRTNKPGAVGDLAVVFDDDRKFVGIGLWDPHAAIPVRLLHTGAPQQIDTDFFTARLVEALDRRRALEQDPSTTGYRLVHGENDQLPGLVVDRYDRSLVVKLDTAAWIPHLGHVVPLLIDLVDAERVVLRSSRSAEKSLPPSLASGTTIHGDAPQAPVRFHENGLVFQADLVHGQKTGFFLDQRDNRQLVAAQARDGDVLDLFCNSGGFSVHAAVGGARSVHSVDLSAHAIAATATHLLLNEDQIGNHVACTQQVADAFDAIDMLRRGRRRFDLVIVDPPSFAPNNDAVPAAENAYRRLASAAAELVHDGGWFFQASCSSRIDNTQFYDIVHEGITEADRTAGQSIRTSHAVDHPIGFVHGSYLKAVLTQLH